MCYVCCVLVLAIDWWMVLIVEHLVSQLNGLFIAGTDTSIAEEWFEQI